jgi:hypothetical protein
MCTHPDPASVRISACALADAFVATSRALATLVVALLAAPVRPVLRRRRAYPRPASVRHVDIQVHLEDPHYVAVLQHIIQLTLARAARTWAPLPLPIDRIVAGIGFPARGTSSAYENFPRTPEAVEDGSDGTGRPLVVIMLGLRDGERDLQPAEVAAALAGQIEAGIADRYPRRSIAAAMTPSPTVNPQLTVGRTATNADKTSTKKPTGRPTPAPQPRGVPDDEAEETSTEFDPSPLGQSTNGKAA